MPITWNNENLAKLLIAIVQQLRANAVKLDYNQLATHMGPGCSVGAIRTCMSRVGRAAEGNSSNLNSDGASPASKSTPSKKATRAPRTPRKRKFDELNFETTIKSSDGDPTSPVVKTEVEQLGIKVEQDGIKVEQDGIKIEAGNDNEVNLGDLEESHFENDDPSATCSISYSLSATELDI